MELSGNFCVLVEKVLENEMICAKIRVKSRRERIHFFITDGWTRRTLNAEKQYRLAQIVRSGVESMKESELQIDRSCHMVYLLRVYRVPKM